jgi:hypothetical protein
VFISCFAVSKAAQGERLRGLLPAA